MTKRRRDGIVQVAENLIHLSTYNIDRSDPHNVSCNIQNITYMLIHHPCKIREEVTSCCIVIDKANFIRPAQPPHRLVIAPRK